MPEPDLERASVRASRYAHPGFSQETQLLTLHDLVAFLLRRRRIILFTTLVSLMVGIIFCMAATHRYQAQALVEVKRPVDALGVNNLVQGSSQPTEQVSPLEENVTLATKVEEFKSETLALNVIQNLNLEKTQDFLPHRNFNPLEPLLSALSGPAAKDRAGASFMDSPARREHALRIFSSHLTVKVVPGTRILSVAFKNPDPQLAAGVVNALVADATRYDFETRSKSTQQLSGWLGSQMDAVRKHAEEMQEQETQLRRATGTFNLGGTNAAGQEMVYSPILDRLQQSTLALAQAESNRILRGAVNKVVQTGDPILISGLAGSALASNGNPQSSESLDVIKTLLAKQADQQLIVQHDELRLGSANPKLVQEEAELQSIEASIQAERSRLAQRAANDLSIAAQEENTTRLEHAALVKEASQVEDKSLQYEIVRQEAQDARGMYADLYRRLNEAGIVAGLQAADMTTISPALAPDRPSSPKVLLVVPGSIVAGALLGLSLAGLGELRDDTIASIAALESVLPVSVYATLPAFTDSSKEGLFQGLRRRLVPGSIEEAAPDADSPGRPVRAVVDSSSPYTEAMRLLHNAILLSQAKVVLITSGSEGEGKSTTCLNLAITFARSGARTLLVESDLRKPSLSSVLKLRQTQVGLSQMLAGNLSEGSVTSAPGIANLSILPAGQHPPDPYTLISSQKMKDLLNAWRQRFDIVILDSPPLLSASDAASICGSADLSLLIVRAGATRLASLRSSYRILAERTEASLRTVLNGVQPGSEGYREYYGHR